MRQVIVTGGRSYGKRWLIGILSVIAIGVGVVGTVGVLPSCTSMDPAQRDKLLAESAALQKSSMDERVRQAAEVQRQQDAYIAAQAAGDAKAAEAAANARDKANKAVALLDKVIPMIQQGHQVFEASVGADGSVNVSPAAVAVGTAVGGPIGTGIAIGIPLIWSLISSLGWFKKTSEASKNLEAAKSIVAGIDKVSVEDPVLSAALDAKWPSVESKMTPTAKAIVDEHAIT